MISLVLLPPASCIPRGKKLSRVEKRRYLAPTRFFWLSRIFCTTAYSVMPDFETVDAILPTFGHFSESMSVHILLVPFSPYTSVLQQDFNYLKISEFLALYEINVPSYNCDPI